MAAAPEMLRLSSCDIAGISPPPPPPPTPALQAIALVCGHVWQVDSVLRLTEAAEPGRLERLRSPVGMEAATKQGSAAWYCASPWLPALQARQTVGGKGLATQHGIDGRLVWHAAFACCSC